MKYLKNLKGSLLLATSLVVLTSSQVLAATNAILSGIEINPKNNNSYSIVIKANKNVPIIKHVTADNKLVLDIKNIEPAEFVNTVYKNTSNIDHVIVQPVSGNQVRIFVQGRNATLSEIALDTSKNAPIITSNLLQPTTEIISAAPVETLIIKPKKEIAQPIEEFIELEAPIVEETTSTIDIMGLLSKIDFDFLLKLLMVGFMLLVGKKVLINKEPKLDIGISPKNNDLRDQELDLTRSLNNRRDILAEGLRDGSMLKGGNVKSSYAQYGLNEYKNSEYPKYYSSKAKTKMEPNLRNNSFKNESLLNKPAKTTFSRKPSLVPNNNLKTKRTLKTATTETVKAKDNLNNLKFLEAMANIYEKSGRGDLAQGIKNNINKAKAS